MSHLRTAFCVVLCLMLVAPAAFAQERVTITLWHHWGGNRLEMIDKMIADFEARYPWIHVEHVFSETAGAADRMGTLLVSGSAPEVMMVRSTYAFQFMSLGGFRPLDDLIERDGVDLSVFNQGDLRSFQLLGSTYALPSMSGSAWTNLMFYNKNIFANAGLDPEQPPRTWTDWRNSARRTTRTDETGRVVHGGTQIPWLTQIAAWNGAKYWSDDWRRATVTSPETMETLQFMEDLLHDTYGSWSEFLNFFRYGNSFWEGQSSIFFTNNSGFASINLVDFEVGVALAPVNEKNPNSAPVGLVSSTWAYAIPATIAPEKLEAAWLLLKYLTLEEDGAGYFARAQGRPSPVIAFNQHPDYQLNPYWHVVIQAIGYDIPVPPVNFTPIIDQAGDAVMTGAKHPQAALADADRALQIALDQYWATVEQ